MRPQAMPTRRASPWKHSLRQTFWIPLTTSSDPSVAMPTAVAVGATLPLVICTAVIFWLSSIPALTPPNLGVSWSDKVYHAIAFLGYGWSIIMCLIGWRPAWPDRRVVAIVLCWGALFAMSDEWHQSMVVNRSAGWDDVTADVFGLLLATATLPLLRRLFAQLLRRP
ncbi:MAG: VanZ family protein [Candidatus Kapabacteria bacterium]|nr:VanZ family protein [Candidatus Kapabacteria bacterium]